MKPGITTFLFFLPISILLSGCASSGPPLPPSLDLPTPVTDLRAMRKGDSVYLAWTVPTLTTDHQVIRQSGPTLVCRSTAAITDCGAAIGEVAPPELGKTAANRATAANVTATYVDHLSGMGPATGSLKAEVTYAVEVLNPARRGAGLSNQVEEPSAPALPPPDGFRAEITADGVRLTWSCVAPVGGPSPGVQCRLRIYRRLAGSQADSKVAEPDLASCPGPPILDQTFEWEKTYEYRAASVIVISAPGKPDLEIEGDDTPKVTVYAHDVFPPAVPSGLQAVFSGVGQSPFVDLIWSPDTDADLAGYHVYRHEEGEPPVRLTSEPVRAPAYRDNQVLAGRKYFYSVTAIDVRGNESAKSEEANEAVP